MSIQSFDQLRPGDRVVIFARVSTPQQSYRAQLIWLLRRVYKRGARVVWIEECSRSAKFQSAELRRAIAKARRRDAILLACTLDRFIRPLDFNSRVPSTYEVGAADLQRLLKWTKGVRLMTWLDPQATASEAWQHHTRRGLWFRRFDASGDQQPGCKVRRRIRLRAVARHLKADGYQWAEIAEFLNVPKWTLIDWFR